MPRRYIKVQPPSELVNLAVGWQTKALTSSGFSTDATDTFEYGNRVIQGTVNSGAYGGRYYKAARVVEWLGTADTSKKYIVTCEFMDMTEKSGSYVGWYTNGTMSTIGSVLRATNEKNVWQRVAVLCTVTNSIDSRCQGLAVGDTFKYAYREFAIYDVTNIDSSYYEAIARQDWYAIRTALSAIDARGFGPGLTRQGDILSIDIANKDELASGTHYKAVTADVLRAWIEDGDSFKVKDNQGNDILLENLAKNYTTVIMSSSSHSTNAQDVVWDNIRSCWGTVNSPAYGERYFAKEKLINDFGMVGGRKYIISTDIRHETRKPGSYVKLTSIYGASVESAIGNVPRSSDVFNEWVHVAVLLPFNTSYNLDFPTYGLVAGDQFRMSFKNLCIYDVTDIPEEYYPIIAAGKTPLLQEESPVQINGRAISYQKASVADVIGNTTNKNYIVDAGTLNSAINLGRAVDVTTGALGYGGWSEISFDGGTTWKTLSIALLKQYENSSAWRGNVSIRRTSADTSQHWIGFSIYGLGVEVFPKRNDNFLYLALCDVRVPGVAINNAYLSTYNPSATQHTFSGSANQTDYTRVWGLFAGSTGRFFLSCNPTSGSSPRLDIKTWRQYEVTNLSDEAIETLANLPADQLDDAYYKYLVKQDAVCPFIPAIDLSDAATVSIQAGLYYRINASSGSHTLTVNTVPEDSDGENAYLTLVTTTNSTILVQQPLMLMDPIKPNAINNCTIQYRNGQARLYVDDTTTGYVVTITSGLDEGSIYYGLSRALAEHESIEYISFANVTNSVLIHVSGSVATLYKPISLTGNGRDLTSVTFDTGMIGTTQAFTASYIALSDFTWLNGTMSLNRCKLDGTIHIADTGTISLGSYTEFNANVVGANITIAPGSTVSGTGSIDLQQTQSKRPEITAGVLEGITIYNGKMAGYGGGFWTANTSAQVDTINVTVIGCSASSSGGGFSYRSKYGSIISVTVKGCTAGTWGGAFETSHNNSSGKYCELSNIVIQDCVASKGGGVAVYNNKSNIMDLSITGCRAVTAGGGLALAANALANVTNAVISNNSCTNTSGGGGGGISVDGSTLNLTGTTVSGNTGAYNGVYNGLLASSAKLSFTNCIFDENQGITCAGATSITISSNNVFKSVVSAAEGTITIMNGSTTSLVGNPIGNAIVASVIVIQGGLSTKPTSIVSNTDAANVFEDFEIRGKTISNTGLVYGATIYATNADHYVYYVSNGQTNSIILRGTTTYVVPGALIQVSGT